MQNSKETKNKKAKHKNMQSTKYYATNWPTYNNDSLQTYDNSKFKFLKIQNSPLPKTNIFKIQRIFFTMKTNRTQNCKII